MYSFTSSHLWHTPARGHALRALLSLFALLVGVTACADNEDEIIVPPNEETLAGVAQNTPRLSTLAAALDAAGLVDDLQAEGPFTVFAPTNEAFGALEDGMLDSLLAGGNEPLLTKVLQYHAVQGEITAAELEDGEVLTTVDGTPLVIDAGVDGLFVNGVAFVTPDFANPSNGVLHLIGGVLTQNLNVVERASITPRLSRLAAALDDADLMEPLSSADSTYTVFAPADEAFDTLPEGTLAGLSPEGRADLLRYHIVSGTAALLGNLEDGQNLTTLQGGTLTVNIAEDGSVEVTDAQNNTYAVTTADLVVRNGVVHIIGGVLLPPPSGSGS